MTTRLIIAEDVNAYTYLGEPVPFVPLKTPKREGLCPACNTLISVTVKGLKSTCTECKQKINIESFEERKLTKVTTRHMIEYGLCPSVSRLAHYGEMPFELSRWSINETVNFVMDNYHPNRQTWMNVVNRDLKAFKERFADRGTEIHKWIQKVMDGDFVTLPDDEVIQRCTAEIVQWTLEQGFTHIQTERCYSNPNIGMGGTIDFQADSVVADFKTKHNPKTFEAIQKGNTTYMWSAIKQLAGYSLIHPMEISKAYVIPISNETGECYWHEISQDDMSRGEKAMRTALEAWFADVGYDPREMHFKGQAWNLEQILNQGKD